VKSLFVEVSRCVPGMRRVETRNPVVNELNQRPNNDYFQINIPQTMNPIRPYDLGSDYLPDSYTINRIVFENYRMITLYWVEESSDHYSSFGYYVKYISYFSIPKDADLSGTFLLEEGDDDYYRRSNVEQYITSDEQRYRQRLRDLQYELDRVRMERVILPEETIRKIHEGTIDCEGKPLKVKVFDEEDEDIFNI